MRINKLPRFPLLPAKNPGSMAVLPLPLDLGGRPGTGSGAVWLAEGLRNAEIAEMIGASYDVVEPILCEVAFGRVEPSLYAAALTLQAWQAGYRPLWLFGDHGLSYGPVRAATLFGRKVTSFIFDAHYDRFDGLLKRMNRSCSLPGEIHQGNVASWIGSDPAVRKLVQIGVRQKVTAVDLDHVPSVAILTASEIREHPLAAKGWIIEQIREAFTYGDLIVLSMDVDVLDPKVVPAVDHPLQGGLTISELLELALPVAEIACAIDIVELNPLRDRDNQGCRAALLVASTFLASTPPVSSVPWFTVLEQRPLNALHAIGPCTNVIVDDRHWWEPDPAEAAILKEMPMDELVATFQESALVHATSNIRVVSAKREFGAVNKVSPPNSVMTPETFLNNGEHHIESIAVSPQANLLAAAGWDHSVYIWDMAFPDHAPIKSEGHSEWVTAIAFAPSGLQLATVSDDKTLRLWRIDEAACTAEFICERHKEWVKAVCWSPDGNRVASGGFDGSVGIWNSRTGECLHFFQAHPDSIWGLAWSADGEFLASCGERGQLRLWNPNSGQHLRDLHGHIGSVERCRFTKDLHLWSLSRKGVLHLHHHDRTESVLKLQTGVEQALDMAMINGDELLLIAGLRTVRCIHSERLNAEMDLKLNFPVGAITAWGQNIAVGGDNPQIALFRLPNR